MCCKVLAVDALTKPAGHSWLWIANSDLVYYRTGGTAIVPTLDVVDGAGCMPLPASPGIFLNVRSVETLSFIGTAVCGYAWMRDQSDL